MPDNVCLKYFSLKKSKVRPFLVYYGQYHFSKYFTDQNTNRKIITINFKMAIAPFFPKTCNAKYQPAVTNALETI